jgi:hypothetical protein
MGTVISFLLSMSSCQKVTCMTKAGHYNMQAFFSLSMTTCNSVAPQSTQQILLLGLTETKTLPVK